MNYKSKYTSIIETKNGTNIPVFYNGKSVDSKYNPQRESENIIKSIEKKYSFFIIIGVGSGVLIDQLNTSLPNCKIICVENNLQDYNFLRQLSIIKKLDNSNNIIFTDINNISNELINNYIPALYGDIKIIEQRGWVQEYSDILNILYGNIKKALAVISADYSVQCHFGKIWQKNIINNLKMCSNYINNNALIPDLTKPAIVVAAGPTLDKTIARIKNNKNIFIISTDTAYNVLLKNKIIPDIVISIDGQFVSHIHFTDVNNTKTFFALDLCSNYSIGKHLIENNNNVVYFTSGHPLSALAASFQKKVAANTNSLNLFPNLYSGAGTVTITAIDLALKLGFHDIEVLGADFSYVNGKSYSKGTYFDKLYCVENNKLNSNEKLFDKLLFRTELIKKNNKYETEILNSYKNSLEQYLTTNQCQFHKDNEIYYIKNKNNYRLINKIKNSNFDFNNFMENIKNMNIEELKLPLLPYIAWLRNQKKISSDEIIPLLKLAQSHIVSYN